MHPKDFPWTSEQTCCVCPFFFSLKPTVWNLFTSQYILDCEELKPTSKFAVTVFIYKFPQYTTISDQVVMCELSWHMLKGCTCDYMTFSNVWHNLPNNLWDKINLMVLDTFSTRPMTTLSSMFVIMVTDTIVIDIGSTGEFVIGFAVAPPACGNVIIVRIIHQLISRSLSRCSQFMSIYSSQILTYSN